jgi:hypothetical protein
VKRGRQSEQRLPQQEKEKPDQEKSGRALQETHCGGEAAALGREQSGHFFQARRTDHAFGMFGDALAAVKPAALRTTGRGLAELMIQTALFSQARHTFFSG